MLDSGIWGMGNAKLNLFSFWVKKSGTISCDGEKKKNKKLKKLLAQGMLLFCHVLSRAFYKQHGFERKSTRWINNRKCEGVKIFQSSVISYIQNGVPILSLLQYSRIFGKE